MNKIADTVMGLYRMSALKRVLVICIALQVILWSVFAITYVLNLDAWQNVAVFESSNQPSGSIPGMIAFIVINNLVLLLLIAFGNIFARFGMVTPGLLVLLVQGIIIGMTAGSNAFEFPFASVLDANMQYLKVGLWETTAYSLICAVTLTKSLNIAETFPPKQWSETRKLKELHFDGAEKGLVVLSVLILIAAAVIEAVLITG